MGTLTCECSLLDTREYCSSGEAGLGPRCSSVDWADQVETAKGVSGGFRWMFYAIFEVEVQNCCDCSKVKEAKSKGKQVKDGAALPGAPASG